MKAGAVVKSRGFDYSTFLQNTMIQEARRSKHNSHYVRDSIYPVDEIISHVKAGRYRQYQFGNIYIGLSKRRYKVFACSGTTCVECGIKARYFALERFRSQSKYHMNLYAVRFGVERMMTRDHIQPVSKGGSNHLNNQQTMCIECNISKGDTENENTNSN